MIAHPGQAIEMAKLVPSRSTEPKMLDPAGSVEQAQGPEIEKMREWSDERGAPTATWPRWNRRGAAATPPGRLPSRSSTASAPR
ncbi:DUF305 domain-containing protein [Actinokineospora sp. HBU206404]|uniref:DUF305 domain-containing protein n=1 Tax=Actinokineospora xionganensis TaxID=2684470 RepID=A0ABR7LDV2_9PSEU|nr:DUF305 domain-containing protein [Actinokineospora xionganensis]